MITLGISGVARSGKDFLGKLLCEYFEAAGLKADTFSFASELKKDLDGFLIEKFGISSFTENDTEKALIRPLLIAYGQAKRKQSNGTYWIGQAARAISDRSELDVAILTDVRFSENEYDEVEFIQETMNGSVIHLTRIAQDGTEVLPNNLDEEKNNPKIKERADLLLSWEQVSLSDARQHVRIFMDSTVGIWKK